MRGDAIQEHARALREAHDGEFADAAATRRRILEVAYARARRRRRLVVLVAPMAAVLVLSSAWAAVTGRLPRLAAFLTQHAPAAPQPSRSGPSEVRQAVGDQGVTQVTSAPSPGAPVDLGAPSSPVSSALPSSSAEASAAPGAPEVRAPRPRASAADASTYAEESLYEAAHRAHFVARDPTAALRAWDEYLSEYPAGRFAPEARYNRAMTLVRLGRIDEARAALAPFAEGAYNGYRRTEARELLDVLGSTDR